MSKSTSQWYAAHDNKKEIKFETAEEFLARGGHIQKFGCKTRMKKKKVDAQKLLDAAVGTPEEQEVVAFLRKQGIQVD